MVSDADIKAIRLPILLWARVVRDLRQRGAGVRETGAFLLGRLDTENPRVTSPIFVMMMSIPTPISSVPSLSMPPGCAALWQHCREQKVQLLIDVHTHPGMDRPAEPHRCPQSDVAGNWPYGRDRPALRKYPVVVAETYRRLRVLRGVQVAARIWQQRSTGALNSHSGDRRHDRVRQ